MRVYLRVLSYMREYWLLEAAAYLCMLAINGVLLVTPQITRRIVDVGIGQQQMGVLTLMSLALLGITILRGGLRFGESFCAETVSQGIAYRIRNQVYRKLHSLSFSYHDRAQTGQLLSRSTSDVERVREFTGRGLLRLFDSVILVLSTTAVLLRMQPTLAALSLAVMPFVAVLMVWYLGVQHPMWHDRQDRMAIMTSRLEQNLRGTRVVRGFAQEPQEVVRFDGVNDLIYDISIAIARIGSWVMPVVVLLASVGTVLILWVGGRMVVAGQLTLGGLVAFNSYLLQLVNPVRRLGFTINMLGEAHASAERVFEILDAKSEVQNRPGAHELGAIQGAVTFDHVSFAYVGSNKVLEDVSFAVEPGKVVALLGPTGAGKSTITNLIPRFYDATEGAIRIDGTDIRDVTLNSLRRQIGIVLQETLLFGSTIRENITFGRPDATEEEMIAAAKAASAHEFISSFPRGYDTEVGERGVTLSGGQRQRVAIARALLLDPRILILDDATSSVDTDTEQLIQAALQALMHGRTSFVIAQRVSTVRLADQILIIDRGRLVAQGRHDELIAESGIYADIYYRQLRQEDGAPEPAAAVRAAAGRS